jgi:hypothetical protein
MEMKLGRAGCHHQTIKFLSCNIVNDLLLCCIRTGEHVSSSNHNSGILSDLFPDPLHVYEV